MCSNGVEECSDQAKGRCESRFSVFAGKKKAKRKASLILKDVGVCFKKSARILLSIRLKRSLTFCEISRIRCCGGDKVKDEKTLK